MYGQYGVNSLKQKKINHGLVLNMIATERADSRIKISKRIGLSKMALSNITAELIDKKYIEETIKVSTNKVGRNRQRLDISAEAPKAVGVYISRNRIVAILSDMKVNILYMSEYLLKDESNQTLTRKIIDACDEIFTVAKIKFGAPKIMAIGIAAIGPLDSVTGVILNPPDFYGISNLPICDILNEKYGIPVLINNDINLSALAENLYGYGKQYKNFIYLGLTMGIGTGIISDGDLFQQRSSFVGEIGHMTIDRNGPMCTCGQRGCLETYVSIPRIVDHMRTVTKRESISYKNMEELYSHPECREFFDEIADDIAIALVNISNLLDPQCIVIGHEGYYLPEKCLERIKATLNKGILCKDSHSIELVRSSFKENAPIIGSACLVWQQLFDGLII
ncbi:MAG: ROK family protein [Clostridia bacterium]|nr:ROK family protein [Clostridia bacterium]